MKFEAFPKISRWSREVVITEKIDGTNAQILIERNDAGLEGYHVYAGSRNRWLDMFDSQKDNYGFAQWVMKHRGELIEGLGEGRHYGEWWGHGIQRNYDLKEKRFSLFNTSRWNKDNVPQCCHVVPVLWQGVLDEDYKPISTAMNMLRFNGSYAAPGYMNPEGICIYHVHAKTYFKKTFEKDDVGKEAA